jgi:hypothetical protein
MKSRARWSEANYIKNYGKPPPRTLVGKTGNKTKKRPDHGMLRGDVPEPAFLADPSHRKKTLRNKLYAILNRRKADQHGMTEMDVMRITTNFVYMVHQLPGLSRSEWSDAAKAVLEHHFNNHSYCGDFCVRLKELSGKKKKDNREGKIYRSKTKDKELYEKL